MTNREKRQAWETREGMTCSYPEADTPEEARKLWRQFLAENALELLFDGARTAFWYLDDAADWRLCLASSNTRTWDREEYSKAIRLARSMPPICLPS